MKELIGKKMYQMSHSQYKKMLDMASEQVERGIYAIEKKGYAELRNDTGSITNLKNMRRDFKRQGFKVYTNGI